MQFAGIIQIFAAALLTLGLAGAPLSTRAAELSRGAPPARPVRRLSLDQLRAFPNQPDAQLEGAQVATIGYLMRVRRIAPAASAGQADGPRYRLWLVKHKPYVMKGLTERRRAVVASGPVARLLGGFPALRHLVGRRVWVSGQMAFNSAQRDQLMWTRGSMWEIQSLSEIAPCPPKSCSLARPPRKIATPAATPPAPKSAKR